MDLHKITGIILVILGILVGLISFEIVQQYIGTIDIIMIGVAIFILHEVGALLMNTFHSDNKLVSLSIPLIFIIIAGSYFIKDMLPEVISANLILIIAALMCAEGLYRLH